MNRLFWGIVFLVLAAAGGWAQATWRGQAEVWSGGTVPSDGFVAASNEFPRNSLLSVENFRTKKTVQVRVVSALPPGSSALVLLNPRAALALDIKAGEVPLVGVRLDPTGVERPDNPDPDVNPLAQAPATKPTPKPTATATPVPTATPAAPVAAPVVPVAPVVVAPPLPVPSLVPEARDTVPRTPAPAALDLAKAPAALDPALMPLPALAAPEPVPAPAALETPTPLAVADEAEASPVTPGKQVFVSTRDPAPVATETAPVPVVEPAPVLDPEPTAEPELALAPEPTVEPESTVEAEPTVEPEPSIVPEVVAEPEAVAEAVAEPEPEAEPSPELVLEPTPEPVLPPAAAVVVAPVPAPVAVALPPPSAWVSVPGSLTGPVLGQVAYLSGLEKGRTYVQVGAWATEADLLKVMDTVKTYVPLAVYKAEGTKTPWRLVAPSAPKAQLGVLVMQFRSAGFRNAAVIKG